MRFDFLYVFANQGKSSDPSQMQMLPQAVGDGGVLLHINREVKKIFIFATHLKGKKKKGGGLGTKYTADPVAKALSVYG